MSGQSYYRDCKHCGRKIQMRQMPAGQWVAFEGLDTAHDCKAAPAPRSFQSGEEKPLPPPIAKPVAPASRFDDDDLEDMGIAELGLPDGLVEKLSRLGIGNALGLRGLTESELEGLGPGRNLVQDCMDRLFGSESQLVRATKPPLLGLPTVSSYPVVAKPVPVAPPARAATSVPTPVPARPLAPAPAPSGPVTDNASARPAPLLWTTPSSQARVATNKPEKDPERGSKMGCWAMVGMVWLSLYSLSGFFGQFKSEPAPSGPEVAPAPVVATEPPAPVPQEPPAAGEGRRSIIGLYQGYTGGSGAGIVTITSPTSDASYRLGYERSIYQGEPFAKLPLQSTVLVEYESASSTLFSLIVVDGPPPGAPSSEAVESTPAVESQDPEPEPEQLTSPADRLAWAMAGTTSDARAARAVYEYYDLIGNDGFPTAYDNCSAKYKAEKSVRQYIEQWSTNRGVTVVDTFAVTVSPDGTSATVPTLLLFYETTGDLICEAMIEFVLEDGVWKFDGGEFKTEPVAAEGGPTR